MDLDVYTEAMIATRYAFFPAEDTRVIERPGWLQLITPSLQQGGVNEVAFSVIDEAEAEAVIDATIAEYDRHQLRFRWCVTPETRPKDLAERLEKRGFKKTLIRALARPTSGLTDLRDSAIKIDEVGEHNVDLFTRMVSEGWGMEFEPLNRFHRRVLSNPNRMHHMYVAFYDGVLAGAANMAMLPR